MTAAPFPVRRRSRGPVHRRRWAQVLACALALTLFGCTTTPARLPSHSASARTAAAQSPEQRCGGPAAGGRIATFAASDGVRLDGAEVGSGRVGAVLVHEYPADLCGFWPYAVYLSRHGLRVLAIDLRCFGRSACPSTAAARRDLAADVIGAVAELRRRGADRVGVLGASLGGTVALAAAASPQPGLSAVICLSCHARFTPLVGGTAVPLDVVGAVHSIRCPALFVVGRDDPHLAAGEVQSLYRDVGSADRHLDVLTGPQTAVHGWDLLASTPAGGADVASIVAAFLLRHTAPR